MTGNGDVFLHADYSRKDEMEDEQVDLLLNRIKTSLIGATQKGQL